VKSESADVETMHTVFQYVIFALSALGSLVVIWGVIDAIVAFTSLKLRRPRQELFTQSESIRQRLGSHLLLGLEIFIGGDIISSVVSPSWEKVGILASIVGVRTVLSYFLRRELRQVLRS